MSTPGTLRTLDDMNMTVADPAEDVRGRKVIDRAGEEIGKVDALLVDDQEQKVRFLRLASGGILGIGEKHFLIPVDAITGMSDDEVYIDRTGEHVAGSPAYDPDVAPDQEVYESYYGYYGYAPFWTAGYVAPAFPYYMV